MRGISIVMYTVLSYIFLFFTIILKSITSIVHGLEGIIEPFAYVIAGFILYLAIGLLNLLITQLASVVLLVIITVIGIALARTFLALPGFLMEIIIQLLVMVLAIAEELIQVLGNISERKLVYFLCKLDERIVSV